MALLDTVNWDALGEEAAKAMLPYYADLLALAYDDASSGGLDVSFDLENENVKRVLDLLAKRIKGISETTKDKVRALVEQQAEEGWSTAELAKRIREQGVTDSKYRSEMISRSESRDAYNFGSLTAYGDAGVTKVIALDSDNDPECSARNGKTYTLEEAAALEPHPNCVLALSPVVD